MVDDIFNEKEDLKVLVEAQKKIIISLNKKINELEANKLQVVSISNNIDSNLIKTTDDEETIARTQLNLLKNISLSRELTYEETKKVDIYAKLLISLMGRNKKKDLPGEEASTNDLLSIVENE